MLEDDGARSGPGTARENHYAESPPGILQEGGKAHELKDFFKQYGVEYDKLFTADDEDETYSADGSMDDDEAPDASSTTVVTATDIDSSSLPRTTNPMADSIPQFASSSSMLSLLESQIDEPLLRSITSPVAGLPPVSPLAPLAPLSTGSMQSSPLTGADEVRAGILEALDVNRRYQEMLKRQLEVIELAEANNKMMQKKVRDLFNQQARIRKQRDMQRDNPGVPNRKLGPPFFVDIDGNVPPENEDTKRRKAYPQYKYRRWTDKERENLAHAVRLQNMKLIADDFYEQGKDLWSVEKMSKRKLEMPNVDKLDWEMISKQHVPTRTPIECLIQWTGQDHPVINKSEWTKHESQLLEQLVQTHGRKGHWATIAIALGTNRTSAQCFRHYQSRLNKDILRRRWTETEDDLLKEAVTIYGEKNWQQVAHILDNRTGQQCLHRWSKTLNPAIRRGRWRVDEDEALRNAVEVYGSGNWVKIQQHVLGRTDVQCRERWMNVLCPDVEQGPWSEEENAKLLDLVDKVGEHSWSRIAQDIPGRTDNQCWRRWKMIIKEREAREREVDPAASTNGGGKKKKKKRSEEEEEEERSAVGNKRRKGSEASVGGQPRKKNKIQGDILVQRGAKEQETEAETQETETEIEQGKGKGKGKGRGKGKGKGKENEKERKGKETSMEADEGSEGEAEVVEEDVGGKEKKKKMWTKKPFTVTMPGLIQSFRLEAEKSKSKEGGHRQRPFGLADFIRPIAPSVANMRAMRRLIEWEKGNMRATRSMVNVVQEPDLITLMGAAPLSKPTSSDTDPLAGAEAFNSTLSLPILPEAKQQTEEFRLLQARFEAMFAWPMMIGTFGGLAMDEEADNDEVAAALSQVRGRVNMEQRPTTEGSMPVEAESGGDSGDDIAGSSGDDAQSAEKGGEKESQVEDREGLKGNEREVRLSRRTAMAAPGESVP